MTEEQLNEIGRKLAEWSNYYQKTIKINGKPINLAEGPMWAEIEEQTPDGPKVSCIPIFSINWPTALAADDNNNILRENLRSIIQQSDCKTEVLLTYVSNLTGTDWLRQLTAEKLAEDLGCLGQLEFTSVEIE
jgi:hypothetical protein